MGKDLKQEGDNSKSGKRRNDETAVARTVLINCETPIFLLQCLRDSEIIEKENRFNKYRQLVLR